MRIYANPCFTRFSIDKSDKIKMSSSVENFGPSSNESTSPNSCRILEEEKENFVNKNHGDYALGDGINDSLTTEYRGHTSKNRRTNKRKIIAAIIILLFFLLLAGVVAFICIYSNRGNPRNQNTNTSREKTDSSKQQGDNQDFHKNNKTLKSQDVCYTEKCKSVASYLRKTMNMSADPCDNFYEFSCGKWSQVHPLPASMSKLDTMGLLTLRKMNDLKEIILQESKNPHPTGFKAKILKFYASCINSDAHENRKRNRLLDLIDRLGGWSPINSWIDNKNVIDISDLLVRTHKYFTPSVYDDRLYSPLFKSSVTVNNSNSDQHIFELSLPHFPLKDYSDFFATTQRAVAVRKTYALLKANYVALFGPSTNADKILKALNEFEMDLVNITRPYMEQRNLYEQYMSLSIKKFTAYAGSQINWLRVIRGIFEPANIKVSEEMKIGVRSPSFFVKLNNLIQRTDEQIVKDYIIWVFIWRFGPYSSSLCREADYNFQKTLLGIQKRPKRWKGCLKDIEDTMEFGLTTLYVERAITDRDKIAANEIVKNITREFKKNLISVEWMDISTKAAAFKKVDAIEGNIGYPDFVKNYTYIDEIYKQVRVHRSTYFKNILSMYKVKRTSILERLKQPVDRTTYDLPPTLVEAYYDPTKNKMVFLAGILHKPFLDTQVPMALNYGALGLVVGHELTHAFDDLGRQFDGKGEMKNWWSNSSSSQFRKRKKCIVDQYSNYTIFGVNVNGQMTLGENIADNGGIKVAYMAYKDWERRHGEEKRLPGISLNMDQLLFVSHGQVWCGAYREAYVRMALNTDFHAPSKFRVVGPLSNLKQFSEAFNCPLGSRMNPVKKCRVW